MGEGVGSSTLENDATADQWRKCEQRNAPTWRRWEAAPSVPLGPPPYRCISLKGPKTRPCAPAVLPPPPPFIASPPTS